MSDLDAPPAETATNTEKPAAAAPRRVPAAARSVFQTLAAYLIGVAFGSSLSHLNLI